MTAAEPQTPVDEALAQLARARRDRWGVVVVLVVAIVVAVLLAVAGDGGQLTPWALAAMAVVAVGYGVSVADQERRDHRAVAALIEERARTTALDARIVSLEHLHAAARDLLAADELPDVFDRLLAGALVVTGASSGAVLLRVGDAVTVATSGGSGRPPRGTSLPLDDGPIGAVVRQGEVVLAASAPWAGTGDGSPDGAADLLPGGRSPGATSERRTIAAPLRLPDRVVGALVVVREPGDNVTPADVTAASLFAEHAALAVRNAARLDELTASVDSLERAADARAEDIAGLVHDLTSPLASISGFVELLRDRGDDIGPERRRAVLADVRREVERVRDLVDGVVQLAAAEAGAIHLDAVVDLTELVRDAAATGRGLALEQGSEREIRVAVPRPAPVAADPIALRRVIANLLDNAVAYSPPGTPIDLAVTPGEQAIRLTVRDHGAGVDPAVRAALFEPYVRGRRGRTGLGLFVARTLIEAHGGHIRLVPADGGGTLAEVVLPSARAGGR